MTVISANQPQDLDSTQLKVHFFGLGNRSSLGVEINGGRHNLDTVSESPELSKFMRAGETPFDLILDLSRASQSHDQIRFYVEAGSNDSVSWSVESLHDSTNLQSEGVAIPASETMTLLSFDQVGADWQITSLEKRDASEAHAQSPNQEIPSSIQDLEMIARGGNSKNQKFSSIQILIDMTISMKPHLITSRIQNLVSAIQAMGVASGATSVETNFGGLRNIETDISDELEDHIKKNLVESMNSPEIATNMRRLLPEAAQTAKKKTKFFIITDGFFLIADDTLKQIEDKGHLVDVLILDSDEIKIQMPSSPALRLIEIEAGAEDGRDFLSQISA